MAAARLLKFTISPPLSATGALAAFDINLVIAGNSSRHRQFLLNVVVLSLHM